MAVELGGAFYNFDVVFEDGVAALKLINKETGKTEKVLKDFVIQTNKTNQGFQSVGRNAGQAGIQIQQFVGQVQGGQDAMLALSAQAADLGIVLGAPLVGAVVGIAAALGGSLIPSLSGSSDQLEELIEKLDELEDKSGITINQTKLLIQEKQKEAKAIGESTSATVEQILTLQRQLDMMQTAGTGLDTGQFAVPRTAAQNQSRYAESIVETQNRLVELRAVLDDNNSSLIAVNNEITDLQTGNAKANEELDKLISRLEYEANIIGLTERGIALYTAEMLGATQAQKDQINVKYDLIEAQELELEGQRELAKQLRQEAREREALSNRVMSIGLTQTQAIQQRYDQELSLLRQTKEKEIITLEEFAEKEKQIAQNKADAIDRYNQQQLQNQALFNQTQGQLLGSLNNLFGTFANATDARDRKSFEKKKKFQTAQALINTAMAISNALAAAPPPINFALAGAAGAAGAVQVAAIQNQQFSGGRQFGGGVSQGSAYRVGEGDMPELYRSSNGQLGMIPGDNGRVIPMDKMGGGIGNVEVYISGVPSELGKPSASVIDNKIKIAFNQFYNDVAEGKGKAGAAFRQGTNLRFQSNR